MLLLNANQVVSKEDLATALWGENRPSAAEAGLRNHVLRLRRQLGAEAGARVRTVAPGYLLKLNEGELDEHAFLDGCREGRRQMLAGESGAARETLAAALGLWAGEPLADLPPSMDVMVRVQHLQETRLTAWETRIEADLLLGGGQELVAELRGLAEAHPLREALHGQLMLALYRAGRKAEALEAFQALRRTLVSELGLEPSELVQHLHRRILDADSDLMATARTSAAPTAPAVVVADSPSGSSETRAGALRQLPADTRVFTGRSRELDQLLTLADQALASGRAGSLVISAIDGMAGIGKSALAVHAAHLLRDRFPDGHLFIDLHGHTSGIDPLTAAEALDRLLRSLGLQPQLIPGDLGERAAVYRDRLAGTRTLIVLDNAESTAQIRPLLPGAAGSLVLITSRRRLTGLDDAYTVPLDLLTETEARELLHQVAGPGRIPDGHAATDELTTLCGHLPLAIRITAARLRHRPALQPQDLAEQLRDEHGRLDHLKDEDRSLAVVFASSYTALPRDERRLFRLLGLAPGADFDVYAAANLLGVPRDSAERLLESLLDQNLLIQHAPGRYRFHDLVRLYARTLDTRDAGDAGDAGDPARAPEHKEALERLLDYYQHTTQLADRHLARPCRPGPLRANVPHPVAPHLADRTAALVWLRTESGNILAAAAAATRTAPHRTVALTAALAGFLYQEGPWTQASALHRAAAAAAQEQNDQYGQANALWELGQVRTVAGDFNASKTVLAQSLTIYQQLGDRLGEANSLWGLGRAHYAVGDFAESKDMLDRALSLYEDLSDPLGEANALWDLGRVQLATGHYSAADSLYEQALAIFQKLGGHEGEANALWDLGRVRPATGHYPAADSLYQQAREMFQERGHRLGEANALWDLGRVQLAAGEHRDAERMLDQSLAILRELGNRLGEAYALWDLGRVRLAGGDHQAAEDMYRQALAIFEKLGSHDGAANSLHELARVRHATGQLPNALDLLNKSLRLFEEIGNSQGSAEVRASAAAWSTPL
ncbi:tetratricopeptide repeat protein [Streptacidiphilus sp. N1-3]|uniref:Tetratricopeptide repeat protein n=1 Tax=Streptacidiphilus alkalitolerans TaxID=3342712 RepID=A0ABV6WZE0_9ACTN